MGKLKEISSFKRRELSYELGKEGPNNYGIIFKGQKKFWKVVQSKKLADRMVATLKRRGKDADVLQTAARTTEEVVYPHKMYDPKTGKAYTAKTPEDHERMAKLGYTHDDPNSSEKEESVKVRKNKTGMMGAKTQVHKDKKRELSKTAARKKVSMDEKVEYLTLNQIKKNWAKEYPGTKFKFQVSKYKGAEMGNELESYNKVQGWTVREMKEEIEKEIEEGVDDPAIFKAIFLAGGPGSGKSFTIGKTGLGALGFRIVNSDDVFEFALKKAGLETTPKDIFSPKGQEIRGGAKKLTAKKMDLYLDGRLGLVIDGTGKDFNKIKKQSDALKKLGYDVGMIFVNTNLETAIARDAERKRTIGADKVKVMWQEVQDNIGKFQNFFGGDFMVVDNSEGANWQKATLGAYKKFSKFAKTPVRSPIAKKWIKDAGGRLKDSYSLDMQRKISMVECVLGRVNMDIQIAESITLNSKPSEIKELYKKLHGKNDKGRRQQTQ
jgi:shikimate kinase